MTKWQLAMHRRREPRNRKIVLWPRVFVVPAVRTLVLDASTMVPHDASRMPRGSPMMLPIDHEARRLEVGHWLLAADEAADRMMARADMSLAQAEVAAYRIRQHARKRAWAALDGLVEIDPAELRCLAEMCWLKEYHAPGEIADHWHDTGQRLFEATAALQVALDAAREHKTGLEAVA